jgi:acyl transferase domain-containing protein
VLQVCQAQKRVVDEVTHHRVANTGHKGRDHHDHMLVLEVTSREDLQDGPGATMDEEGECRCS